MRRARTGSSITRRSLKFVRSIPHEVFARLAVGFIFLTLFVMTLFNPRSTLDRLR
jgi:ABC-type phosphate/phosphonate transport system permease subunit